MFEKRFFPKINLKLLITPFELKALMELRYYYKIEKITHRPSAEDIITVIKEIREYDLQIGRIVASRIYLDELYEIQGKYSPASFSSYDIRKGRGYNLQLLLIDTNDEKVFVVKTTMEKIRAVIEPQKEEEKKIFYKLGLDDLILKI